MVGQEQAFAGGDGLQSRLQQWEVETGSAVVARGMLRWPGMKLLVVLGECIYFQHSCRHAISC